MTTLAPVRPAVIRTDRWAGLGPNWFASVMGTGIVAIALTGLHFPVPSVPTVLWLLATTLLIVLSAGTVLRWRRHPDVKTLDDPVLAQFWGAPAMALMTVGASTLLVGRHSIGLDAALAVDWVLWSAGTALGLGTAVAIPLRMMTSLRGKPFGGWLMPVVPPMVSAANGALLIPHLPPGQAQLTMLMACSAMFGISLFATLAVLPQIWQQLVRHGPGPAATVPTVWIVLGPLGQSVTAADLLSTRAADVLPAPYDTAAPAIALFYGVPVWGFAMMWLCLAAALTIRTARQGLPFALTWWSFTFPVGTVTTGTTALAVRTHAVLFEVAAVALCLLLATAWLTVATKTAYAVRMKAI